MQRSKAFTSYAWAFLVYLVGVIMFGAWVRITHSGAGCGEHWPTCQGDFVPTDPSLETIIEYTHRLTSGMCGIFGIIFVVWAWRRFGKGPIFWAAASTLLFIIIEGAVGAGLVLGELVADNDSVARAVIISIHLVNTLMLTGSATLAAWWSMGGTMPKRDSRWAPWLVAAAALVVLTCMSGAVTALGDTLFPTAPALTEGLWAKLRDELAPTEHFLVRLRVIHPFLAIATSVVVFGLGARIRYTASAGRARRAALALMIVIGLQSFAGFLNISLAAPGWLQMGHLAVAQGLWVVLTILICEATGNA